ncbi:MAG TPA: DUF2125 domain-containing protein [Azospirillaceae bacterium]|nr:DUF2125 domain-containing protein [Azospirillaceae bacterium]
MRLRPASVALSLLLLLVLAYTAWWVSASWTVRRALDDFAARQRAEGATLAYQGPEIGGFPFAVEATVRDLDYVRPDGVRWQAQALALAAPPWDPYAIAVALPGRQRATLPAAGARPLLDLVAAGGEGTLSLRPDGGLAALELALAKATLSPGPAAEGEAGTWPEMLTAARLVLGLRHPDVPPADHRAPGLTLRLAAEGASLPPVPGMAAVLDWVELTARVMGPPPAELSPAALSAWSGAGGTVELELARLDWGRLSASGSATVALDGTLQPIGAGSVKARGFESVVETLTAQGGLRPNQAAMVQTALSLLAQRGEDGVPVLTLPLTLQDRTLSAGPLPLAKVPEIRWE